MIDLNELGFKEPKFKYEIFKSVERKDFKLADNVLIGYVIHDNCPCPMAWNSRTGLAYDTVANFIRYDLEHIEIPINEYDYTEGDMKEAMDYQLKRFGLKETK